MSAGEVPEREAAFCAQGAAAPGDCRNGQREARSGCEARSTREAQERPGDATVGACRENAAQPGGVSAESATDKLELIVGAAGLARLAAAHVLVLGLGGVGSNCVEALARGGVGNLMLVDRDTVQPSNINRQAIAFTSTLGRRKVDAMRDMVADINPAACVETRHMLVLRENLDDLLAQAQAWARDAGGELDYVVDAIDTVSTKLALAEAAQQRGLPLVSSMGAANKIHPECLRIADLYDTVNCPLCRIMRKECRKRGIRRLRVLYSCEEPVRVPVRQGAARAERSNLGTISYMPPIMGQMVAGAVIRSIAGLEEAGSCGAGGRAC